MGIVGENDASTVDHDAPTELAPTQASELVEPHLAWELCADEPEPPSRARRVTSLALAGSLLAIGLSGALAIAYIQPRDVEVAAEPADSSAPAGAVIPEPAPAPLLPPPPETSTTPTAAAAPGVPAVPRLRDGTYRATYDWPNSKTRQADAYYFAPLTQQAQTSAVMALRTTCGSECVVTVAPLNDQGGPHPSIAPSEMRYSDGAWRETLNWMAHQCILPSGMPGGTDQVSSMAHIYPDTYSGTLTYAVGESTCGNGGRTLTTPLTLTRTGDAPKWLG